MLQYRLSPAYVRGKDGFTQPKGIDPHQIRPCCNRYIMRVVWRDVVVGDEEYPLDGRFGRADVAPRVNERSHTQREVSTAHPWRNIPVQQLKTVAIAISRDTGLNRVANAFASSSASAWIDLSEPCRLFYVKHQPAIMERRLCI